MNKSLQLSLLVWKFFVKTHPDADLEAVVEMIVEETQKETLKEVVEWLISRITFSEVYGYCLKISNEEWEVLKRGEMPE